MDIYGFNEYDKIIDSKMTLFLRIKLFLRYKFKKKYILPGGFHKNEPIIGFFENHKLKAFMIGSIVQDFDGNDFLNLVYIHSFYHGYGKKLLLTFVNKYNIKDILYTRSDCDGFWYKIEEICSKNGISIRQPGVKK